MPIRVALVDDDALSRGSIEIILNANPDIEVVGVADDGDEAVSLVQRTRPDVVLMDLQMRRVDGVTATRDIRALPSPPEVLVMTVWDTDEYIGRAITAGASGFITKSFAPDDIVAAVRGVADGGAVLSASATRFAMDAVRGREPRGTRREAVDRVATLTERELQVARLVSDGLTNEEVGACLYISLNTVKQHVSDISRKLAVHKRAQIAVVMTASGYEPNIWG